MKKIVLLVCAAASAAGLFLNSADARDFRVVDAGLERVIRVDESGRTWEVKNNGADLLPLNLKPVLLVPIARAAMVPELAGSAGAISWRNSTVGGVYALEFGDVQKALEGAEYLLLAGYEATPVVLRKRQSRFTPADPFFWHQWNLTNTGANGGLAGIDLRVLPVWRSFRGAGIAIAIVDDGMQATHPDLIQNSFPVTANLTASMHYNFNENNTNPSPRGNDAHGTAVAGVAAARSNNLGGVGVAPEARLAGIRLTAAYVSDETEASAFVWRNPVLHIYNNSWGPSDDGATVEGPGPAGAAALQRGATFGRGGLGTIYTWACGNGRQDFDDSNFDGYANSIFTIAIGALSDRGMQSSESEHGANVVAVTPSSSFDRQGIVSPDLVGARGYNIDGSNDGAVIPRRNFANLDYTNDFGMTSGATPQASGVIALMLQANPRLGWRDVQEILIRTSRRIHTADADWRRNGAGFWFNHRYGAGLIDANAAVQLAATWRNLAPAAEFGLNQFNLAARIPDNNPNGAVARFVVPVNATNPRLRVEHVRFAVWVTHPRRGQLRFVLTSPSGKQSIVQQRPYDWTPNLLGWTFMSVHHWGEPSNGVWTLRVIDTQAGNSGTLQHARLILRGARM